MTFPVLPVLSQRTYPGVGDIDDCSIIATIWAAADSRPSLRRPTVTEFRRYAGEPDVPGQSNGLNIFQCNTAADKCWPDLRSELYTVKDYPIILGLIKDGHPLSVATDSSMLPARLRYNFYGKHQVGVAYDGAHIRCMNPLAVEGTRPPVITAAELQKAMKALIPGDSRPYRALMFPLPVPGVLWGWDVDYKIRMAYTARHVAAKLFDLGIRTYGERVNEVDLEAGLKARGINYGSSVQLVDAQALMRPGTN